MKNLLLSCLCAGVLFFGCKSDDDAMPQDNLSGNWDLILVSGGLAGVSDTIPKGAITYNFNDGLLKVVNNNTVPVIYSFLQTGEYTYELSGAGNEQTLTINTNPYQVITLTTSDFVLGDNLPLDGFSFTFER